MHFLIAAALTAAMLVPEARAQSGGYGIRSIPAPSPSRAHADSHPGYEGDYDRDYKAWRDQRQSCLYARRKRDRKWCADNFQPVPAPPLPSDYVKARRGY